MRKLFEICGTLIFGLAVLSAVLAVGVHAGTATTKTVINDGWYSESATGTNAMALTVTPGKPFAIRQMGLKSDKSNTGNLTVSLDAGLGSGYDVTIHTEAMTNAVSKIIEFDPPLVFDGADKINIDWQPTDATTTWSVNFVWSDHY